MVGPSEASIAAYHLKISDEDKKEKEETDKLRAENGEEPAVEELPEGIGKIRPLSHFKSNFIPCYSTP
jgi:hypothetical protein